MKVAQDDRDKRKLRHAGEKSRRREQLFPLRRWSRGHTRIESFGMGVLTIEMPRAAHPLGGRWLFSPAALLCGMTLRANRRLHLANALTLLATSLGEPEEV
jgi:hypothetical protein